MKNVSRSELEWAMQKAWALLRQLKLPDVSFGEAVEAYIRARNGRRPRTLSEIRGLCRRVMRLEPGFAARVVHSVTRADCMNIIQRETTLRQQYKLRVILHGVFEYCRLQEWCLDNPVGMLRLPHPVENEIVPLSWDELVRLTRLARTRRHSACMAPLGLMLWAGVRPAEVCRLEWADIDWEESVVVMRPLHSKTGGSRHIPMHEVLRRWLQHAGAGQGCICPPNWPRRWLALRREAGLLPWRQDVLRHTYASYHAKHFHDFCVLQESMGHRSASLLRTRYLSMRGLTAEQARRFWRPGEL